MKSDPHFAPGSIINIGTNAGLTGWQNHAIRMTNAAALTGVVIYILELALSRVSGFGSNQPVLWVFIIALPFLLLTWYLNSRQKYLLAGIWVNLSLTLPLGLAMVFNPGSGNHQVHFLILCLLPVITIHNQSKAAIRVLGLLNVILFLSSWFIPAATSQPAWGDIAGPGLQLVEFLPAAGLILLLGYHLLSSRRYATGLETKVTELLDVFSNLNEMASTDKLTGISNRQQVEQQLLNEILRAERYGIPLAMIMFDIDHFKKVNDTFGHEAGDKVLQDIVFLVERTIRAIDHFGRWGGEEFIVILPETDLAGAQAAAEKIRRVVSEHAFSVAGQITVSLGVASWSKDQTIDTLFRQVDKALYKAKESGRNRVELSEQESPGLQDMPLVNWKPEWNSGVQKIDDEHRELLDNLNSYSKAVLDNRPVQETLSLMVLLEKNLGDHFTDEEAILSGASYPETKQHAGIHRYLISKFRHLSDEFKAGDIKPVALYLFVFNEIVVGHMLNMDVRYFPHMEKYRLSVPQKNGG